MTALPGRPRHPPAAASAWVAPLTATLAALIAILVISSLVLAVIDDSATRFVGALLWAVFPLVGVVILRNRPSNTVGWCFMVAGLLNAMNELGDVGLALAYHRHWPDLLAHVFAWSTASTWFPGLGILITVALLHFPDGRAVSPRWRWLSAAAIATMSVYALSLSLVVWSVPVALLASDQTPHSSGWREVILVIGFACFPVMLPIVIGTVASLVVRWRRSSGIGRLQIRWVAAAGTLAVLIEVGLDVYGTFGTVGDTLQTIVESFGFGLIAVATGVAITRHRLYDIDRIVSRSVGYLLISALLVGVYAGVVTGAGLIIPESYGSVGVAVATLAAVAMFVPLRRRIQHLVDRRFDRARYDADQMVGTFAATLREDLSQPALADELLRAVRHAVAPSTASLWVAPGGRRVEN